MAHWKFRYQYGQDEDTTCFQCLSIATNNANHSKVGDKLSECGDSGTGVVLHEQQLVVALNRAP